MTCYFFFVFWGFLLFKMKRNSDQWPFDKSLVFVVRAKANWFLDWISKKKVWRITLVFLGAIIFVVYFYYYYHFCLQYFSACSTISLFLSHFILSLLNYYLISVSISFCFFISISQFLSFSLILVVDFCIFPLFYLFWY